VGVARLFAQRVVATRDEGCEILNGTRAGRHSATL
jgi:hypothetical protein